MCLKYLLVSRFKFPESSILMLTEATDPLRIPTKHNIRMAMYWLVQGCQRADSLAFTILVMVHSRETTLEMKWMDMMKPSVLLDFETQGMIVDDEINAAIVRPFPRGVKLHAIIDAGHSGTVLDSGQYVWEDHRPQSGVWKGTSGGEVIPFSGVNYDDYQTAADMLALLKITSTVAMTYCFIQAIEHGQVATYGSMLNLMRSTIHNDLGSGGGCVVTSLMTLLVTGVSLTGGFVPDLRLIRRLECYVVVGYFR
ncbi:hypothetical protein RJ641_007964, partial [Dillenia turbinata]